MLSFLANSITTKFITGVIAIWFKDSELVKLGSAVSFSYFEQKAKDFYEARQTQRFFEEIGDRVLRDLSEFIKAEHGGVKKGDIKIIVEDILSFISSSDFFEICISERFEFDRIIVLTEEQLHTHPRSLGVTSDNYNSICRHIVARFVLVVDTLPQFNRSALNRLLIDTELILERIGAIEAIVDNQRIKITLEISESHISYNKTVARRFDSISLFGVDSRTLPKKYDLNIAYINLKLSSDDALSGERPELMLTSHISEGVSTCLITGSAGSGKTTLLSWIILNILRRTLPDELSEIEHYVPLFFRIREFASSPLPSGSELVRNQLGVSEAAVSDDWVAEQLRIGRFIFLIDGFDEVSVERRSEIADWIVDLIRSFPDSLFYISSRQYAAHQVLNTLHDEGVTVRDLTVEPMDLAQIEEFVEHWYRAYCDDAREQETLLRLRAAKERLLDSIASSAHLRSISTNPLLCALICFVNADREGFIPSMRGELYTIAAETLLERREKERKILDSVITTLNKNQKLKILGYIAEYLFNRRSPVLPLGDVAKHIAQFLPALGIDTDRSVCIVEQMTERSHILRSPTEGFVDFSHKTFQEYFFARRVIDANFREMMVGKFFDEDFSEVVLFVCSLGPADLVDYMIREVQALKQGEGVDDRSKEEERKHLIFLHHAVNEAAELDVSLRETISGELNAILPPKSMEEAYDLGVVGRNVIQPLEPFKAKKYQKYWPYCAEALIATFDEEAFPALADYAKLQSAEVDQILVRGGRFYVSEKYNKLVLGECKTLKKLTVEDIFDFELLDALNSVESVEFRQYEDEVGRLSRKKNVRRIELDGCRSFADLGILDAFPNCKELIILNCIGLDDFTCIGRCASLEYLSIDSEDLYSLEFLAGLKKLKIVHLGDCVNLQSASEIDDLLSVVEVSLPFADLYDDLNPRLRPQEFELDPDTGDYL